MLVPNAKGFAMQWNIGFTLKKNSKCFFAYSSLKHIYRKNVTSHHGSTFLRLQ